MEFADEKIAALLNEAEKLEVSNDILAGPVQIGNQYYEFEERAFYDDRVKIYMPKDFDELPESYKKIKYPSSERPEIIKSDEHGVVNITLNRVDNDLEEEWVAELTDGMKAMMKKLNPAYVFYSDGVEAVGEKNIGYLEFKSPALDGFMYNLMFLFEFDGQTVMGTFCCMYKEYTNWRDIAFQIVKTIRVVKGEEQT
ncbi:hypothetical protein [Paenibacillus radicis (ex Gao et al. 2016)]|uniref:Uncharacterized protein n=1 Tax=Paenibacillus radicis (ex Gao et al. 2016) TaxID=1737354 RepID=A0A917M6Y2_9BACL|nr:hypothetical protein [Paenibacillus radicis (ex Gao et al. 2016)]GGG82855.1 hypothetical protein GCM10010918_45460 [Paenibacillus radicis (ex Gao et al. 2016)]